MYAVEKGIPIPKPKSGGAPSKYPWDQLAVGDSFLVPDKTKKTFSSQLLYRGKRNGCKYIARDVEGGVRVWRVK